MKNFNSLFVESKYPILASFYNDLNKLNSLQPRTERSKEEKRVCMIIPQDYIMSF